MSRPINLAKNDALIIGSDCFEAIGRLPDNSVDAVITDPPYFLDKLASNWDVDGMSVTEGGTVSSLPSGMKFDPAQGIQFQAFMHEVAEACFRVLKPGGFFLGFSAPRLYHRLAVGVEDAGYEIRDMWSWIYTQNQVKAMRVDRFVDTSGWSQADIDALMEDLEVWKTPQIKSCIEPVVFAQKPKTDANGKAITFAQNWLANRVGLVNTAATVGDGMVPANILTEGPISAALDRAFLVPKPDKEERGGTKHLSVKPLNLMDQLIKLTVPEGGVVLDPFSGSGSTGISAVRTSRRYIGVELHPDYLQQSLTRFKKAVGGFSWRKAKNDKVWRGKSR